MMASVLIWPLWSSILVILTTGGASVETSETSKVPVDVDVSKKEQDKICITPSIEFPEGITYAIQQDARSTHNIGRVTDGDQLISMGDSTSVSRCVLVMVRPDDSKYVRIVDRKSRTGGIVGTANEFVKRAGGLSYSAIARTPVTIDVFAQDVDEKINIKLVMSQKHRRRPSTIPSDLETMPLKFSVQENVMDEVTIGIVKYNGDILESQVDGLIFREVLWEGGLDRPIITIRSRYSNETESEVKYRFNIESSEFCPVYTKRIHVNLCN